MTEEQSNLLSAARNLINFVKSKYPGEELYCPYMKALDEACKGVDPQHLNLSLIDTETKKNNE